LVNKWIELEIVPARPGPRELSIEDDVYAFQTCGAEALERAVQRHGLTLYDDVTTGANIENLRHVFLRQLEGLLDAPVNVLTAGFDPGAPALGHPL
jgi:hypothetical protein